MASHRLLLALVTAVVLLAPASALAHQSTGADTPWSAAWSTVNGNPDSVRLDIHVGTGGLECGIVASLAQGVLFTSVAGSGVSLNSQTPLPPARAFFGFQVEPPTSEGGDLILTLGTSSPLPADGKLDISAFPHCATGAGSVQFPALEAPPTDPCAQQKANLARLQSELTVATAELNKLEAEVGRLDDELRELAGEAQVSGRTRSIELAFTRIVAANNEAAEKAALAKGKVTKLAAQVKEAQSAVDQCEASHPLRRSLASAAADCTQASYALAKAQGRVAGYALALRPFLKLDYTGEARTIDQVAGILRKESSAKARAGAALAKKIAARMRHAAADLAAAKAAAAKAATAVTADKAALAKCKAGG